MKGSKINTPLDEPEQSLADFERVLDDHLRDAIVQRLDHIQKQQIFIGVMVFVIGMSWAVSKIYPEVVSENWTVS